MTRHTQLVGEQRDFNQILNHHAQHHVVRDLAHARKLPLAAVGGARPRQKAPAGPDATEDSLRARITLALPLTGATIYWAPAASRRSRTAADSSTPIVEQSTNVAGNLPFPEFTPAGPK